MSKKLQNMDDIVRDARMKEEAENITKRLSHIRHKILVMSGKGGVGKSSIAAYLAVSLAGRGYRVGLMDVDLHGPSIPGLLGLKDKLLTTGGPEGKTFPLKYLPKLEVMSIEVLLGDKDAATIWRGPLKGGVIRQFIAEIEWMELDYLIIDSPPGTGDEPLTVAQTIPDAKALIVTTPQEISLADVRKSINFCRKMNLEVLGLVENMSGLKCPHCGEMINLFKTGGGEKAAKTMNITFLGRIPIDPNIVETSDAGKAFIYDFAKSDAGKAMQEIVNKVIQKTSGK